MERAQFPWSDARQQTDDSLRREREKVDGHLAGRNLSTIDELADAVIADARARADEGVAASRAQTDGDFAARGGTPSPALARERIQDERAIREERAHADERLRRERATFDGILSRERQQTDTSLASERAGSDVTLARQDDVLGIVAHDLRSMLHAVLGYADLVLVEEARESPREQVRVHVQHIQQAGTRMNRLIGDLIDVSCIRAGMLAVTLENTDLAHTVMEAVDAFRAHGLTNGVSVRAEVDTSCCTPHDPARLLQVLGNLLSNAIKFSAPSGEVIVHLDRTDCELRCAVSDTGSGIPRDKLDIIFERFVQLNKNDCRSLGLGLYISKCIVQAHGGRLWAESNVGQGSTFYFTLPLAVSAAIRHADGMVPDGDI